MLGLKTSRRGPAPAAFAVFAVVTLLGALLPTGAAAAEEASDVLGEAPRVEVSKSVEEPVTLAPGLWSDVLGPAPENPHQFVYRRTVDRSAVHLSVTGLLGAEDGVEITTSTPRVDDCGTATLEGETLTGWEQMPVGVRLSVAESDLSSECMLAAVPLRIEIGRLSSSTGSEELPIRIKVVEEAPLANPNDADNGVLPEPPSTDEPLLIPEPGEPEEVEPGRGFDDADRLVSGTVSATLEPGQAHFFRAPVGWGQTVAARVDVEPLAPPDTDTMLFGGPEIAVAVADPLRNPLPSNLSGTDEVVTTEFDDPEAVVEPVTATTGLGPVTWLDRVSNGSAYLPGEHWIIVSVRNDGDDADDVPVPYRLTVEVQGERDEAPAYADDAAGFVIGPDTWSATASGHTAAAEEDGDWLTGRRGVGLGLVAGGLVCLAVGALQVRRARA